MKVTYENLIGAQMMQSALKDTLRMWHRELPNHRDFIMDVIGVVDEQAKLLAYEWEHGEVDEMAKEFSNDSRQNTATH